MTPYRSVLITPPAGEPISLIEAKLRAGLDWVAGDARDALMNTFIATARAKVENDTSLALLQQTRDLYFDRLERWPMDLGAPLQSVTSITSDGVVMAAGDYVVDVGGSRIVPSTTGTPWPKDFRPLTPWIIRVVVGWPNVAAIPPPLVWAVGALTAHYATLGRDLVLVGHIVANTPYGYEDAIAPYVRVSLA